MTDELKGADEMLMALDQERQNTPESQMSWELKYGFAHDCHCADDMLNGETESVPHCWAEAAEMAFNKLAETRGGIWGIIMSESTDGEAIQRALKSIFYGEPSTEADEA